MLRQVSIEEITKDVFGAEPVIIDVRTALEWKQGVIPEAKCFDVMCPTFKSEVQTLNKDRSYLLYCSDGSRSIQACLIMRVLGFKDLCDLKGGIGTWEDELKIYED